MALSSVLTHTYVYTQTKAYIHLIQLLMHPLTNRPHTLSHTHKQALTSVLLPLLCASPVAGPSLQSVIAASVAWTDRRTGDWRWHAPIISGPSAVFAITESLAEHTESDSGSLYSGAISTPTGCTASVDHSLAGLGLSINLKNCFWWSLDRISESGLHFFLNVWIKSPTIQMSFLFFFLRQHSGDRGRQDKQSGEKGCLAVAGLNVDSLEAEQKGRRGPNWTLSACHISSKWHSKHQCGVI